MSRGYYEAGLRALIASQWRTRNEFPIGTRVRVVGWQYSEGREWVGRRGEVVAHLFTGSSDMRVRIDDSGEEIRFQRAQLRREDGISPNV